MAIEEEFYNALRLRASILLDLTQDALSSMLFNPADAENYLRPGQDALYIGAAAGLAREAEALTLTIYTRAGVPWDSLAARYEVSRQALHRRTSSLGEALWEEAQFREHDFYEQTSLVRDLSKLSLDDVDAHVQEGTGGFLEARRVPRWWTR